MWPPGISSKLAISSTRQAGPGSTLETERRSIIRKAATILLLLTLAFGLACDTLLEDMIEQLFLDSLNSQRAELLQDDNLHVIMIGTGGPINFENRTAPSTAVIAGGKFYLVDVGPDSIRSADLLNLPLGDLTGVFLTHFHSDHIANLGEANFFSLVNGRNLPLQVYGPQGVETVVQGFTQAYALDTGYRYAHHGDTVIELSASEPESNTIEFLDPDSFEEEVLIVDEPDFKVYAYNVDHFPAKPAVGYRFEYRGNVVAFTGDTKKTDYLASHFQDADILVSVGLSHRITSIMAEIAAENSRPRLAKILTDIQNYQMSPVQAAEVARDAGVEKLVFHHIVPPLPVQPFETVFLEGVGEVFPGRVIVGTDGLSFSLPPK